MDKRGRKQKISNNKSWVSKLGKQGIIQSLIIHIIVLLLMALSFTTIHQHRAIKLNVNFETEPEEYSIEPISIEMPQPEFNNEESVDLGSAIYIPDDQSIHIDIVEVLDTTKSSIPAENISSELINTSIDIDTKDQNAKSTQRTSTKINQSHGRQSSQDRFNIMMQGKLDDRLAKHGANSGDIQISISWDDYNDIDLWVEFQPFHFRKNTHLIGWTNRESINGGYLDIDMNVQPFTNEAVENIVWPKNRSPYGTYTVYAHYYHQWDINHTTQVYLRVQCDDKVIYKKAVVNFGSGPQKLHTFIRKPSKH